MTIVVLELSPDPCPVEKSRLFDGIACRARSCDAVSSSSRAVPPLVEAVSHHRARTRKRWCVVVKAGVDGKGRETGTVGEDEDEEEEEEEEEMK